MISLEELKPIIEPLLTEENAASIIEAISAIDREVEQPEVDYTEHDNELRASIDKDWNERFKQAFFGPKADSLDGTIPDEEPAEPEVEEVDGEDISIEDVLTVEEEKEGE